MPRMKIPAADAYVAVEAWEHPDVQGSLVLSALVLFFIGCLQFFFVSSILAAHFLYESFDLSRSSFNLSFSSFSTLFLYPA